MEFLQEHRKLISFEFIKLQYLLWLIRFSGVGNWKNKINGKEFEFEFEQWEKFRVNLGRARAMKRKLKLKNKPNCWCVEWGMNYEEMEERPLQILQLRHPSVAGDFLQIVIACTAFAFLFWKVVSGHFELFYFCFVLLRNCLPRLLHPCSRVP